MPPPRLSNPGTSCVETFAVTVVLNSATAPLPPLCMPPPPPGPRVRLPLTVLLRIVRVPRLSTPPPTSVTPLSVIVLSMIVSVPLFQIPPPLSLTKPLWRTTLRRVSTCRVAYRPPWVAEPRRRVSPPR